jgi:hypothetical protein
MTNAPGAPFSFINPTRHHLNLLHSSSASSASSALVNGLRLLYRSRDARKGRHALLLPPSRDIFFSLPVPTNSIRSTLHGISLMFTRFPIWDISYLVAIFFTIGSLTWCVNGFLVFLPLIGYGDGKGVIYAAGWIAWVGATIFELGSVLLVLEAVNAGREWCFGWAVQERMAVIEEVVAGKRWMVSRDIDGCVHHHCEKRSLFKKPKGWQVLFLLMRCSDFWATFLEIKLIHCFSCIGPAFYK